MGGKIWSSYIVVIKTSKALIITNLVLSIYLTWFNVSFVSPHSPHKNTLKKTFNFRDNTCKSFEERQKISREHRQFNILLASSNQEVFILTPTKWILWKLTINFANNRKLDLITIIFIQLFSPTIKIYSPNCKCDKLHTLCYQSESCEISHMILKHLS